PRPGDAARVPPKGGWSWPPATASAWRCSPSAPQGGLVLAPRDRLGLAMQPECPPRGAGLGPPRPPRPGDAARVPPKGGMISFVPAWLDSGQDRHPGGPKGGFLVLPRRTSGLPRRGSSVLPRRGCALGGGWLGRLFDVGHHVLHLGELATLPSVEEARDGR